MYWPHSSSKSGLIFLRIDVGRARDSQADDIFSLVLPAAPVEKSQTNGPF
jgi:hypothetical protein